MGLDMYLSVKRNLEFKAINEGQYDGLYYQKYEEVGIGYWRKFNALHSYIVKNFADGIDTCQTIYLSESYIEMILRDLNRIAKEPTEIVAMRVMPPEAGFYFGSTQITEWYMQDVVRSIPIFEEALRILKEPSEYGVYVIYHASW